MVSSGLAWWRLGRLRAVILEEPRLARAFGRLSLYEQLELTLDLLSEPEPELPENVVRFRPRGDRR